MAELLTRPEFQVENGNFVRIINPLFERLLKVPFKGCELAVALYIIRKTYGFNKTEDQISLTQFEIDLERSRQTIVDALKNLQLVNIARLVKRGSSRKQSNVWGINKYYDTWKLVNMARLVKRRRGTSLAEANKLVVTARHTIDRYKQDKDITISKELLEFWNNHKDLSSVPVVTPINTTTKKVLLKECRGITEDIEKAFSKLKHLSSEELKIGVKNYIRDILNRDPSKDYAKHRFSFYEFFKQDNGFKKFYNK